MFGMTKQKLLKGREQWRLKAATALSPQSQKALSFRTK